MKKTAFLMAAILISTIGNNANADIGIESEVVTFLNNGYHGSVWFGAEGRRIRFVYAKATYPGALTPSGFTNWTSRFKEAEFDFFFGDRKNDFRGPWFAIGAGQTEMSIESKSTAATARITSNDLHSGIGYAISVANKFYVNPWIGIDVHLNVPGSVQVGTETWNPRKVDWVGGMKLGLNF
jgi:hypothetical protein